MKNVKAWLLLISYVGASCAGLGPLVKDAFAHIFWHDHHIHHVHHGDESHSHVVSEIVQLLISDQDQSERFCELQSKIKLVSHYLLASSKHESMSFCSEDFGYPPYLIDLSTGLFSILEMPPERV